MNVWLAGHRLRLDPSTTIGQGGEADVYAIGGRAVKIWKAPGHPDVAGQPLLEQAARERLAEQQRKLPAFPRDLPPQVVAPEQAATDRDGRIAGYAMRLVPDAVELLRLGDRAFRETQAPDERVVAVLCDLHAALSGLHAAGVVVGDLNDLNVLVRERAVHLVDADSFQFGGFRCRAYTERLLDPLLCGPGSPEPIRAPGPDSDWYAFAALLLRCLLFVGPHGGVHRPPPGAPKLPPAARAWHRLSVFHRDVLYPRSARRPDVLPDDLLQHLVQVFEHDRRGRFPIRLLDELRFARCPGCGLEHARATCPACAPASKASVQERISRNGTVCCERLFTTSGEILATAWDGELRVLAREDGRLLREGGALVLEGDPGAGLSAAVCGERTLLVRGDTLVVLAPGQPPRRLGVDRSPDGACLAVRGSRLLRCEAGRLLQEGARGEVPVGDVLPRLTRLWAGPAFGVALARAGGMQLCWLVEDAGLRELALPRAPGQLVAAGCALGADRAFLFLALRDRGQALHRALLLRHDGRLEASAEADPAEVPWLAAVGGRCVAGGALLAPTDDGIVRVEARAGRLEVVRVFADTAPFVDASCSLLATPDALLVVSRREVRRLTLD